MEETTEGLALAQATREEIKNRKRKLDEQVWDRTYLGVDWVA